MANDIRIVHNANTGIIEEIELTDEEQAQLDAEREAFISARNQAKAEQAAKKAAAEAKLEALGLTADDLRAIGL